MNLYQFIIGCIISILVACLLEIHLRHRAKVPRTFQLDTRWVTPEEAFDRISRSPYTEGRQAGWRIWQERQEHHQETGMVWIEYVSPLNRY